MVTLCKTKYDINDKTLFNLCTEAFPIVIFAKRLEDSTRKIMEITECEILPDGERKIRTLFRYNITENSVSKGKVTVNGGFERVNPISESLQKRLRDNGMPLNVLEKLIGGETA
jgi:pilus assembly protein CpaF